MICYVLVHLEGGNLTAKCGVILGEKIAMLLHLQGSGAICYAATRLQVQYGPVAKSAESLPDATGSRNVRACKGVSKLKLNPGLSHES